MSLSDLKIRKAKNRERPYKLADGGGLFRLVKPNGSKLWQQKYRFSPLFAGATCIVRTRLVD